MLEVADVVVSFSGRRILDRVSLTVDPGEVVCVTGPSGCGKSTLLRVIAGLSPPESGVVRWEGVDLHDIPTHRRGFSLMFQDYALFPHRSVGANVAFGLRMAGRSKPEQRAKVEELLTLVGLSGTQNRAVATLSGGEQQRVALARALAPSPRLLLLDEPLGALDRDLHDRLAAEVRAILTTVGISAVHVTHDPAEAAAVGDRVVDLRDLSPAS